MRTMKFLLILSVLAIATFNAAAQTPAITDLRDIIANAPVHFEKLKGEFSKESKGDKIYKTTKEHAGSNAFIVHHSSGNINYYMLYELNAQDALMFKLKNLLLTQYVQELNDMVKTGKYTGEDAQEDGMNITRIKDKKGNKIVELWSRTGFFGIVVYS